MNPLLNSASPSEKILFVDDEPNILEAFERQFRKRFAVETAVGPEDGLAAMETRGPYAVIVSDLRMPGMDGIQFLSRAKELAPDTMRIMLTGHADTAAAINAVNQGSIFRFLNKPCVPEVLAKTIEAALEQRHLQQAERELLEQTLRGSVEVLTEILALASPTVFSQTSRLRHYVCHAASQLGASESWPFEVAAMLSHIGCITVPPAILERVAAGETLSNGEQEIYDAHPRVGRELLEKIPRLEGVAEMIGRHHELCADPGEVLNPSDPLMGARILRAAVDLDRLHMSGKSYSAAIEELRARGNCNLRVLDALSSLSAESAGKELRLVRVNQLASGMTVEQDVLSVGGLLLLARGQLVTEPVITRLQSFRVTQGVVEPIRVLAPLPDLEPASTMPV